MLENLGVIYILVLKELHDLELGERPSEPLLNLHHHLFSLWLMLFGLCLDYPVVEIECEKFEREYDLRVIPLSKAVDLHLKVFLN